MVTNDTPFSATKSTMLASRTKSCAMLTPNGLSVSSRILTISPRTSLELTRRRLDDAEAAGVGDGRGELGPGDEAHRRLHDRMLDSEELRDSGAHGVARYPHDCCRVPPNEPATPVMIEVALNGVTSRRRNPRVPATVEEHTTDALACVDAGATIVHTHAPDLVVGAEEAAEQYATAFRPVVDRHPGIVCYPTVGFGETIKDRYRHVELLDDMGLVRAGAVDTGSVNLGGTGRDGLPPDSEFVYSNPFAKIRYEMEVCADRGLGPSISIFEPGFLQVVLAYTRQLLSPRARS